ncbi:MAG: YIP1 family protein [Nanoarchaeota archaeon]
MKHIYHLRHLFFNPRGFFADLSDEYHFRPFLFYLTISVFVIAFKQIIEVFRTGLAGSFTIRSFIETGLAAKLVLELSFIIAIPPILYSIVHIILALTHSHASLREASAFAQTLGVIFYGHAIMLLYVIPIIIANIFAKQHSLLITFIGIAFALAAIMHTSLIEITGITHIHGVEKGKASLIIALALIVTLILFLHFVFQLVI